MTDFNYLHKLLLVWYKYMIRFSRREDYAVILVTALAQRFNKKPVPLSRIARQYRISLLFLRNLANELRKENIIGAIEGRNGGYFLKKDPKELLMGDVLESFSSSPVLPCCSVGMSRVHLGKCPKEAFCDPGFIWRKLNKEFLEKISCLTVNQFMEYR